MRFELAPHVESDLEEIGDWIAYDNPLRAVTFIQEIRKEFHKIAEGPFLYQLRPEIAPDARLAVVGQYVILFWLDGDLVRIDRVVFGGRDLPVLLP